MTKEKFESYVIVQRSGLTNMWNTQTVIELSSIELTKEDCLDIMKNYAKYEKEFGNEEEK